MLGDSEEGDATRAREREGELFAYRIPSSPTRAFSLTTVTENEDMGDNDASEGISGWRGSLSAPPLQSLSRLFLFRNASAQDRYTLLVRTPSRCFLSVNSPSPASFAHSFFSPSISLDEGLYGFYAEGEKQRQQNPISRSSQFLFLQSANQPIVSPSYCRRRERESARKLLPWKQQHLGGFTESGSDQPPPPLLPPVTVCCSTDVGAWRGSPPFGTSKAKQQTQDDIYLLLPNQNQATASVSLQQKATIYSNTHTEPPTTLNTGVLSSRHAFDHSASCWSVG